MNSKVMPKEIDREVLGSKTTVVAEKLGVPVFYADIEAKNVRSQMQV